MLRMKSSKNISALLPVKESTSISKIRIFIFALEVSLIIFLLIVWFSSESVQKSNNLWVLFLYSFPSQFLIAIVPHEPVFFYYSKFYIPITVTFVSIVGTLITEILNYSVFKFVVDLKSFDNISHGGFIKKIVDIFNKAPFAALWVAGFTPIPFYPLRFLVVLARYPLVKYVLAVFLSRTPRFYILALLGHAIKIPDYWLLVIFVFLIIIANIPIVKNVFNKKRRGTSNNSEKKAN